VYQKIK